MNEELDQQREKSAGALKLAYLLRLEIAKQKALIGKVFFLKKKSNWSFSESLQNFKN